MKKLKTPAIVLIAVAGTFLIIMAYFLATVGIISIFK